MNLLRSATCHPGSPVLATHKSSFAQLNCCSSTLTFCRSCRRQREQNCALLALRPRMQQNGERPLRRDVPGVKIPPGGGTSTTNDISGHESRDLREPSIQLLPWPYSQTINLGILAKHTASPMALCTKYQVGNSVLAQIKPLRERVSRHTHFQRRRCLLRRSTERPAAGGKRHSRLPPSPSLRRFSLDHAAITPCKRSAQDPPHM